MTLLAGINHVAFISADIGRLKSFYARVFDAKCVLDEELTMPRGDRDKTRHAFIDLGAGCVLHPFEMPDSSWLGPMPIFDRGRMDHIALQAASREAFDDVRQRLISEGASDGAVTDFGSVLSVFFLDPDGMRAEIAYWKADTAWR